ncbi:MAG: ribosome silencing factor [Deltaproteobacteria bacterium]|nr:ribosome silencing factor [Deltaproteobacteria bacterium]
MIPKRKKTKKSLNEKEKESFLNAIASAALAKNAEDIVLLDVRKIVSYTNHIMICSGNSDRQICAIADEIEKEASRFGEKPLSVEGYERGYWVIVDFVDTVVHIFQKEPREFYNLEGLFMEAKRIEPQIRKIRKREK